MKPYGVQARIGPLTIEEFERLPDDDQYRSELVRGWAMREPPAGAEHGEIGAGVGMLLGLFVRRRRLGRVFSSETGFVLAEDPPTVRAPDFAFVAEARMPPGGSPIGFLRLAPDLAVEVVSPANTWADITAKVRDYLDAGTRIVWVIEPRSRSVTIHRPGAAPRILDDGELLDGEDVVPGLRLPVARLFPR